MSAEREAAELGASQLLAGFFLPLWLLMVDLCCAWKKNITVFSEFTLTPSFFQGTCLLGALGGHPGREASQGTHSHPFLSALWEHHIDRVWWRREKAQAWPGAAADFSQPPHTHPQDRSEWENGLNLPASTLPKEALTFQSSWQKPWGYLVSSLILDQSQQPLTSPLRCKFFEAISNRC